MQPERRGPSLALPFRLPARLGSLVEDLEVGDLDLAATSVAAVRGLPGRAVQPALDVQHAALLHVVGGELGYLVRGAQGVELGLLALVGGQLQLATALPLGL
jgi:hypothetical protein